MNREKANHSPWLVVTARLLGAITVLTALACPSLADDFAVEVVTENWPPYNYEEEGETKGFATEIVKKTLEHAELSHTIRLGIWKGVYSRALNRNNVLIYTITRTPEREDLFHWIGPIAHRELNLYKLRARKDIQINSVADIKHYRLALQDGDASTQFIFNNHYYPEDKATIVDRRVLSYRMLFANRADLAVGQDLSIAYYMRMDGLPTTQIEKAFSFTVDGAYYLAFNKSSDPRLVERVNTSFNTLKQQGAFEPILDHYRIPNAD
ncbi:MAG: transporter substrate-binding domain-containing protein [Pseudomonadales bacterium]|nr:transporter substrate-binding domain-containing protein [Pseudomonadales bacterium]